MLLVVRCVVARCVTRDPAAGTEENLSEFFVAEK